MESSDMREGEVLWVDPGVLRRVGCPNGFPFRVVRFAGRADNERVWVRGAVLDPTNSMPVDEIMIPVLLDQPRAVRVGYSIRARRPDDPSPVAAVPTAALPGYRRTA